MISILIEPKPQTTLSSRPELLQLNYNPSVIVWKFGPGVDDRSFEGVIIHNGSSDMGMHEVGHHSKVWVKTSFSRFEGSIMLENS